MDSVDGGGTRYVKGVSPARSAWGREIPIFRLPSVERCTHKSGSPRGRRGGTLLLFRADGSGVRCVNRSSPARSAWGREIPIFRLPSVERYANKNGSPRGRRGGTEDTYAVDGGGGGLKRDTCEVTSDANGASERQRGRPVNLGVRAWGKRSVKLPPRGWRGGREGAMLATR